MTPPDRRRQILDAALTCFLERGYLATLIADIRKLSGASTGSIYHFFENKAAIARALLDEAVAGWTGAAASSSITSDVPAEAAIKAATRGLVTWGLANQPLLRFMDELRTIADKDPDFVTLRDAFDAGRELGERHFSIYVLRGEVKPLPFPLAHSLMLGPAYNYLRLVGAGRPPAPDAAEILAEAAWAAVRA